MSDAAGLDPELAGLLQELSQYGNRVRQLLAADPQPVLIAVLDVLEPVGGLPVQGANHPF